jgi:hypothetical protein
MFMDFEQVSTTTSRDRNDIRTDGASGVVDPPPVDALNEDSLDPATLARTAPRLETVVKLLNQPSLARIYTYIGRV